jgi:hypothetical protein
MTTFICSRPNPDRFPSLFNSACDDAYTMHDLWFPWYITPGCRIAGRLVDGTELALGCVLESGVYESGFEGRERGMWLVSKESICVPPDQTQEGRPGNSF